MRIFCIAIAAFLLSVSPAAAQLGQFIISSDSTGADCSIVDNSPGLLSMWVVHENARGVAASRFSAPMPACFIATYLSDDNRAGPSIGSTQSGIAVSYGGCFDAPVAVVRMNFFAAGLTPPNCYYPILPDPVVAGILVLDCDDNEHVAFGAGVGGVINDQYCWCCGPVEDSTWGAIKELFNTKAQE